MNIMKKCFESDYLVPEAIFHCNLGRQLAEYTKRLDWGDFMDGMGIYAVRILDRIYNVIEDDSLTDPECFEKIERIIRIFYEELDLSTKRHNEYE